MRSHGLSLTRNLRIGVVSLVMAATIAAPSPANATTSCGTSNGHVVCVTAPDTPLSGDTTITITNDPNGGKMFATWIPAAGATTSLIKMFTPSPATNDYSFVWPTHKYLDAGGTLRLQHGTRSTAAVEVAVTLANGNVSDFQRSPDDWASFLPGSWTGAGDPTVLAVGDGPSNNNTANAVANRIAAVDPPLFLFLGDIYDTGTFTENRNHYGISAMDAPGSGTLWGATADITQPTLGNHEAANNTDWRDYWHRRPLFTTFTFGGVLFLDVNSNQKMTATSAQYQFIQSAITDPGAPSCVVTFWHTPAISGSVIKGKERDMWGLLANNGGDLLVTGHHHSMAEYKPLDADFNAETAGAHMVQLISGAGGFNLGGALNDSTGNRIAWSQGLMAGLVALTLNGAGGGGTATSISWTFEDVNGANLRSSSVDCSGAQNQAPVVDAGPDQTVTFPDAATLSGSVTDDGLPSPPSLTSTWTQQSGPGTATFADPASPSTTATFSDVGIYVLRLTADDSELQSFDEVTVTVD